MSNVKYERLLSKYEGEKIADILEVFTQILINKKVIKDLEEFERFFDSYKLAEKLAKN